MQSCCLLLTDSVCIVLLPGIANAGHEIYFPCRKSELKYILEPPDHCNRASRSIGYKMARNLIQYKCEYDAGEGLCPCLIFTLPSLNRYCFPGICTDWSKPKSKLLHTHTHTHTYCTHTHTHTHTQKKKEKEHTHMLTCIQP